MQEKNFYLKGNIAFNDRQKSVFEELDKMGSLKPENRYSQEQLNSQSSKVSVITGKKEMKAFRGKESIFKRPEAVLRKRTGTSLRIPDFLKNPHKWKKYTFDDEEMSDVSNKAVAMAFLKELRDRKGPVKMEVNDMTFQTLPSTSTPTPITPAIKFNKHIRDGGEMLANVVTGQGDRPQYINGKFIMPEYVVGQKRAKPHKKPVEKHSTSAPTTSVRLQHLLDEDEEPE